MKNKLFLILVALSLLTIFAVLPLGFYFAEDEFYPFVAIIMFFVAFCVVLLGYPVAFSLAGTGVLFALIGSFFGAFELSLLAAFPQRVMGVISNGPLMAIPLFIFMGVLLEHSQISGELLESMGMLFGKIRGGLGISVCVVGALLAASTGIVGATVVTMGLISLPTMLRYRYSPILASGIISASGTLGQIIPPSIVLIILSDVVNSAYQQAQLNLGNFSPRSISVGDLFIGALIPGLVLVVCYIVYVFLVAIFLPQAAPAIPEDQRPSIASEFYTKLLQGLLPCLLLIVGVLGSILLGVATPTEAASVGCVGALLLALLKKKLNLQVIKKSLLSTLNVNCMVFIIILGSSMFSLVFRGYEGEEYVTEILHNLPGGAFGALLGVMILIFIMGFFLDFFEIIFVVIPVVGPTLLAMDIDPIWFAILIAINLQTSFLTPPFGFSLFYLRGVAPPNITTTHIYLGVIPFIIIQVLIILILWNLPELATWLPEQVYGKS